MTYRCGVGMRAAALGIEPGDPRFTCDRCGKVETALTRDGLPKAFLRKGGPPPGWMAVPRTEFTNYHYCKQCKTAEPPGQTPVAGREGR